MKRTQLPAIALVPAEAVERLREKFRRSKLSTDHDAFWKGVQNSKQPVIAEHSYRESTQWSWDSLGTPTEDEFYGPIG